MAVHDEYNDSFLLPSMGDYYFDALDHVYYKTMEDAIHEIVSTGNRKDILKKAGLKTAFKYYQENPPDIGYDERYESYTFGVIYRIRQSRTIILVMLGLSMEILSFSLLAQLRFHQTMKNSRSLLR